MAPRPSPARFLLALFKVGLTSYGGPAIVAQLREELVVRKGWVREEDFAESLAFAQLVPGPVVPATAAHIAQKMFGPKIVFPAVLAYALPAFLLMLALSAAYFSFGRLPAVHAAFRALGPVIVAIVASSLVSLAQPALQDARGALLALLLAPLFFLPINPVLLVLAAAVVGLAVMPNPENLPAHLAPLKGSRRRGLAWGLGVAAVLGVGMVGLSLANPALARLGLEVAKVSLLAFGGGYTAVALLYHAFVLPKPPVVSAQEFMDGLALGQLTPGPVIITSTFVGYKLAGLVGALVATAYTFFPPACLVAALAPHVARLRTSRAFHRAVRGALAAFVALLFQVLVKVAQEALTSPWTGPASLLALVLLRRQVPVGVLVSAAALLGAVLWS
ncbi:MAG: chromate efflux transporter [Thermoanaerobaculum sp.]